MKKSGLVLTLFIFFINIHSVYSWDSTAAKLYPMAIGNVWSYNYKIFSGPGGCLNLTSELNYTVSITRDTLMPNGKRYFVFESSYLSTSYRRVDSVKMNIYQYSTSTGTECMYDSLKAVINSTFSGCSSLSTVVSFSTINIFGTNRLVRVTRPVPCPGCGRTLVEAIGFYEDYLCLTSGNRTTLNGCIINGVQYGQILNINLINTAIPQKFELLQNYPNPFNPVTYFGFRIAEFGLVKLTIYDALGKEIHVLVNQQLQPGIYEADWNASAFSSGIYFYTIMCGDFTETRKMLVIK